MIGSVDMVALFGESLGDTQFKKMCFIAAFALISTNAATSWAVKERVLVSRRYEMFSVLLRSVALYAVSHKWQSANSIAYLGLLTSHPLFQY